MFKQGGVNFSELQTTHCLPEDQETIILGGWGGGSGIQGRVKKIGKAFCMKSIADS